MYIKCMSVTKTKCTLQCKKFQKMKFSKKIGPLIKTWPHWINFTILTFMSEKNKYFKCLHKIWNKIISFE